MPGDLEVVGAARPDHAIDGVVQTGRFAIEAVREIFDSRGKLKSSPQRPGGDGGLG